MSRHAQRLLCRLLIGILLFAQMAVAAYACPQLSPAGFSHSSTAMVIPPEGGPTDADSSAADTTNPVAEMSACCDGMDQPDPDNPNLCAEHSHFGQQSEQTQTLTVPALLLASFYTVSPLPAPTEPSRPATASPRLAALSPPHAILHCCFRI